MPKIHSLKLAGVLAIVLTLVMTPEANGAVTTVETDRLNGAADAKALDLHLLGRHLTFGLASTKVEANAVTRTLDMRASGVGALLSPQTSVTAATGGENPSEGGRACSAPPLDDLLDRADLPTLVFGDIACGEASTTGSLSSFEAVGTGDVAAMRLRATEILKPAVNALKAVLNPVGDTTLGQLLTATDGPAQQAVTALNDLFGRLLGSGRVVLPTFEPSKTPDDVLHRLQDSDLLRVNLGNAVASNSGGLRTLTSESIARGGTIEVLPAFRGTGLPPLLKITTGESTASVTLDRDRVTADVSAKNTLVRVESELLPTLDALGIKSGPGFLELAPGQSVTLFCDDTLGAVGALCSEISVGQPKETKLADGGLRLESAAVVIHLFKRLDNLVTGVKLATILGDADLGGLAAPIPGLQGLNLGERSDVPGIKLAIAQTSAQASGRQVLGRSDEAARARPEIDTGKETGKELPRTGGLPRTTVAIPALLGAGAAVRLVMRRWPSR